MKSSPAKINKKKLAIELLGLIIIAIIIALPVYIPYLLKQPIPWTNPDPYHDYKSLLETVLSRPDPTSRDEKLEKRIEKAVTSLNTNSIKDFFNNQAKAEYYKAIGDHQTSATAAEKALPFAPSPDYSIEILDLLIENYTALDHPEQIKKYQDLRDERTTI
jgi:hypothetical protein